MASLIKSAVYIILAHYFSLSKTTKLILLDSLLQEVCISSDEDGSLALSSLGLSVCLSQSQTCFFRDKEIPLNNLDLMNKLESCLLCSCFCCLPPSPPYPSTRSALSYWPHCKGILEKSPLAPKLCSLCLSSEFANREFLLS